MKLDITDAHFVELQKKGYTIDMVLMLSWINKELSLEHIIEQSKKIDVLYKSMIRKGLITQENNITKTGIEILTFISKKTNKKFIKPKPEPSEFDKWWAIFPSNDKFSIHGKDFGPTRAFKTKKDSCRLMFNEMVLNKEYTAEEIIEATLYDINLKKNLSYSKNRNELKYLQNSSTYLYQKTFSGFVGMDKVEKPKKRPGTIDI